MKNLKISLVLIIALFVLLSCKKEDMVVKETTKEKLSHHWVLSTSFVNDQEFPEKPKEIYTLNLSEDGLVQERITEIDWSFTTIHNGNWSLSDDEKTLTINRVYTNETRSTDYEILKLTEEELIIKYFYQSGSSEPHGYYIKETYNK